MILLFWIMRAWEIYIRLIEWAACLNKLVKFVFFKQVLVKIFFMKKYFSSENVFIFQLFIHIAIFFYKHSVFLGQIEYAYDFPKLSLILSL